MTAVLVWVLRLIVTIATAELCAGETLKIGAIFDKLSTREYKETALTASIAHVNKALARTDYDVQYVLREIQENDSLGALQATCSLIEEGVIAILGPTSEDNSNVVQSVCDDKDIPLLDVRWDDQPVTPIINFYPYQDVLTDVYVDIINAWGFESFIILYENNESLNRVGELLKFYNKKQNRVVVRQLDTSNSGDYRPVLKELWRSGARHFVLDCSVDILEEVLKQAQQVGMMTNKESYIITNLDFHTVNLYPFQHSDTNITGMRFIDPLSTEIINLATEMNAIQGKLDAIKPWDIRLEVALIRDAIMMFGEALKELPSNFGPPSTTCTSDDVWQFGTTLINLVKGIKFPGYTGNIKFDIKGYRSEFGLEVIELKEGGITKVGNWTVMEGLNISRILPPPPIPEEGSLVNRTFIITGCLTEPYVMTKKITDTLKGNDQYEGYCIDLIQQLSLMEGFNYTFKIRNDTNNGKLINNATGEWDGMIGEVMKGEAHLAIGDLTITSQREEAVDFTTPFMNLGIGILYKKFSKAPPSFFSFADPFAVDVWKMLSAAFFCSSIALFILGRICPAEWQNPYPCIEEPEFLVNQMSLRNCFWFMTGSIMQQGSEIAPIAVSTRMVAGVWWFFTLIMVSSYTANLAAFLTTENPDIQFSNLKELVEVANFKGIKYGAKSGGATVAFFRDTKKEQGSYNAVYDYMTAHPEAMVSDNKDGVNKAEEGSYAFFMESTSIEYETQRRCNLAQVGNMLDEKGYGIAMKKNSTYRTVLSTSILKLQESGVLEKLRRKWWEEQRGGGQCSAESDSGEAKPLNLKNVGGVFWVSIGGSFLSVIFVFCEMCLHVFKRSMLTKIPFTTLFVEELRFYFKFSGMVKPVSYTRTGSGSDQSKSLQSVQDYMPTAIGFKEDIIGKQS